MMHGYGYGVGYMWPMGGMMFGGLLLTALAIGLVVWAVMGTARHEIDHSKISTGTQTARQILAERYARGEINTEEYTQRLATLK